MLGSRRWTSALPSMLKLGWSGPGVRKNTFTHAPHGGGAVWDLGIFLPYSYPYGLLPTKTLWLFNQFSEDTPYYQVKGSLFCINGGEIGVPGICTSDGWCGCIWLCLVLYICHIRKSGKYFFNFFFAFLTFFFNFF